MFELSSKFKRFYDFFKNPFGASSLRDSHFPVIVRTLACLDGRTNRFGSMHGAFLYQPLGLRAAVPMLRMFTEVFIRVLDMFGLGHSMDFPPPRAFRNIYLLRFGWVYWIVVGRECG